MRIKKTKQINFVANCTEIDFNLLYKKYHYHGFYNYINIFIYYLLYKYFYLSMERILRDWDKNKHL